MKRQIEVEQSVFVVRCGSRPCGNAFHLPKTTADGRGPRRRDRLSIFCGIGSGVNPGTTLSHAERLERSHGARNVTRPQTRIAARNGLIPTMFITRVRL